MQQRKDKGYWYWLYMESGNQMISNGYSEIVNRKKTDNAMA
jgi:hypothetical protein